MKNRHALLFAVLILAAALWFGGKEAQRTAYRAVIWQSVKTLLRPFGIH